MARKTLDIKYLIDKVNSKLTNPEFPQESRAGLIVLLETTLMDHDCYNGFKFVTKDPKPHEAEHLWREYYYPNHIVR